MKNIVKEKCENGVHWYNTHKLLGRSILATFFCVVIIIVLNIAKILSTEVVKSQEIETHPKTSTIKKRTYKEISNTSMVSLLELMTLIFAATSVVFGITTYIAQESTQENTRHLSESAQKALLLDLIRHLYRNLVVTYTIYAKMEDTKTKNKRGDVIYSNYPSEEHLIKMKIPIEKVHPEIFYADDTKYAKMDELYLFFRNYNEEIDVICKHLSNLEIDLATKLRDLQTLFFKAGYLTGQICNAVKILWGEKVANDFIIDSQIIVIKEFDKSKGGDGKWEERLSKEESLKNIQINEQLIQSYQLFATTPDIANIFVFVGDENKKNEYETIKKEGKTANSVIPQQYFISKFKSDVEVECGINPSGGEKVYLIPFRQQ